MQNLKPLVHCLSADEWKKNGASKKFKAQTIYLRGMGDNLASLFHDLEQIKTECNSLQEKYRMKQQDQINRVLYLLTIFSAVFMPIQFLTGWFGMNFENMPELKEDNAYYIFIIGICAVSFLFIALLKLFGWCDTFTDPT